jgi:uroporphyrin-III C-methyltransferase
MKNRENICTKGKVFIAGAGPGDVKLITIKAKECLEMAQVVLYDNLVNPDLLTYCSPQCELIFVGKKSNNHLIPQHEINALLISFANQGKNVVRLKGGDPFVFGRGAEEALALKENGIPFEIIPGITAGIAAPAYAGIPVTHRHSCSMVTLISGHKAVHKQHDDINWSALAILNSTLVFYMSLSNIRHIVSQLLANGKSANTTAAVIRCGTTLQQQVLIAELDNIAELVLARNFQPPALLVIGQVVDLANELAWFLPDNLNENC